MGILDGIMGHASTVDVKTLQGELGPLLVEGERLEHGYKLVRDLFVFTDRRLILIDKQGMSGRKVETMSIPYHSIVRFSKESAGTLDLDAELRIWIRGQEDPIKREFRKNDQVNEVYLALSRAVLG